MPVLTLPRLGETMESGRVVGWMKRPGEAFRRGETLVEIESDKTVVELPALADGVLTEILAADGTDLPVGAPLCRYDGDGPETPAVVAPAVVAPAVVAPAVMAPAVVAPAVMAPAVVAPAVMAPAAVPVPSVPDSPPPLAAATEPLRATPVARRLASARGVDLSGLRGTGPRGRVEAADIPSPAAAGTLAQRSWRGTGPGTAVLLHGFAGDGQTWTALAQLLARAGPTVIAPDLPGHGATEAEATGLDDLAAAVAGFLADLPGPVHLVGHSLGGAVAARVARRHPVARLTLIAPAGLDSVIDAEFVAGMADGRAGGLAHLLRRLAVRPPILSPEALAAIAAELGRGRLRALADTLAGGGRQQIDIVPDLAGLDIPVRVLWGLADRILPWTQAARAGPRAALHLIPEAGHMAHWDAPETVAGLLA